jgi:hypothetical protein
LKKGARGGNMVSPTFNPLTGEPVGVQTFGWATLVLDL